MSGDVYEHKISGYLQLARWLVVALAAVAIAALFAAIWFFPGYAAVNPGSFLPTEAWTSELLTAATAQLGWSPLAIPWFLFARDVASFILSMTLGIVILFRGPRTWFGLFTALTFVIQPYANSLFVSIIPHVPPLAILTSVIDQIAWQLMFILFYLFPDGRFVPGWSRWLLLPWIGLNILTLSGLAADFPVLANGWLFIPLVLPLVLSAIGSQIYRQIWRADPVQRAQTKWVGFVIVLMLPLVLAYSFLVPLTAGQLQITDTLGSILLATMFWGTMSWAFLVMIPAALAIAILRYRLWDIDFIIRKTMIYSVLTGVLALVYFGLVILLQTLFESVSGQQSPVALVISTLVIAALFGSLRRRVQGLIDRRFFRQKYNAQRVMAQFAQTARDEVSLEALTEELVRTVQEALQPIQLSVWIRQLKKIPTGQKPSE